MEVITVKSRKYAGDYEVYKYTDIECPAYLEIQSLYDLEKIKTGAYIKDINGIVAPILEVKNYSAGTVIGTRKKKRSLNVITPYGGYFYCTMLFKEDSEEIYQFYIGKIDFKKEKISFSATGSKVKKHLNVNDRMFLRSVFVLGQDIQTAFSRIYNTPLLKMEDKYKASVKFNSIFHHRDAEQIIMESLRDMAQRKGVDREYFMEKLLKSVDKGILKPFHLDVLRILGRSTNDPEIIAMLEPELAITDPSSGKLELPDASFEEVKTIDQPVQTEEKLLT